MYTARFSEQWELIDTLYGDNVAANTESNTGYLNTGNYHRIAVVVHPVDVNDALDVDVEQRIGASGSVAAFHSGDHDITVATTDTKPSVIEIQMEEMNVNGGYTHLNIEVTTANTGGGGNEFAVVVWGLPRSAPASTANLDSVTD